MRVVWGEAQNATRRQRRRLLWRTVSMRGIFGMWTDQHGDLFTDTRRSCRSIGSYTQRRGRGFVGPTPAAKSRKRGKPPQLERQGEDALKSDCASIGARYNETPELCPELQINLISTEKRPTVPCCRGSVIWMRGDTPSGRRGCNAFKQATRSSTYLPSNLRCLFKSIKLMAWQKLCFNLP